MPDLFHYTDAHGDAGIAALGGLVVRSVALDATILDRLGEFGWMSSVSWWTDLDTNRRDLLTDGCGLSSRFISADRTTHRWRAKTTTGLTPWLEWSRGRIDPGHIAALENDRPGRLPERWWVAEVPVWAVRS